MTEDAASRRPSAIQAAQVFILRRALLNGEGELLGEPSFETRGIMQTIQHPTTGAVKMPAWPVRFDGTPRIDMPGFGRGAGWRGGGLGRGDRAFVALLIDTVISSAR